MSVDLRHADRSADDGVLAHVEEAGGSKSRRRRQMRHRSRWLKNSPG